MHYLRVRFISGAVRGRDSTSEPPPVDRLTECETGTPSKRQGLSANAPPKPASNRRRPERRMNRCWSRPIKGLVRSRTQCSSWRGTNQLAKVTANELSDE